MKMGVALNHFLCGSAKVHNTLVLIVLKQVCVSVLAQSTS